MVAASRRMRSGSINRKHALGSSRAEIYLTGPLFGQIVARIERLARHRPYR